MPFSAPVLTYRAKALASNMCSKVLNGHIILTDTSITTILAPEMTYTPYFFPQKVPKTPRRMPSPATNRLTLAPGDYSRVCKQTVPSARAFSPHLSERLFCQAGVVRRGTWREGCVRNKQETQKPTIAPGSGFKPPHSRLQRRKNNRQPACPEREAA